MDADGSAHHEHHMTEHLSYQQAFSRNLGWVTPAEQALLRNKRIATARMGAAVRDFLQGKMTFEEYFGWGDLPDTEKALRFLVGLAPAGLHGAYLVDPSTINLEQRRGPPPHGDHCDADRNRQVHTRCPGGKRHPLQRLAMLLVRRRQGGGQP